ncbi:metallophosphoesterase, partial [bacterium]|nr:metallophosphoesterase [bacterium]
AKGFEENIEAAQAVGLPYQGSIIDLLEELREVGQQAIVVDASTGGKGAPETRTGWINNEEIYKPYANVIEARFWQGGEGPAIAENRAFSLDTSDFESLKGVISALVVSCNTTGFNRVYTAFRNAIKAAGLDIKINIDNIAMRRQNDPGSKGVVDGAEIEISHQKSSEAVSKSLGVPVNVDRVKTSAKGFYIHLATIRGIEEAEEIRNLIMQESRDSSAAFTFLEGTKLQTSELAEMSASESFENSIFFKMMPSHIPGEVNVAFGYAMDIQRPEGEDAGIYGCETLLSGLKGHEKITSISDLMYIPGSDFGDQKGGVAQAPEHHTREDFLQTITGDYGDILAEINMPSSMIPTSHHHIHIMEIEAEGLTPQMVIDALKKHQRVAVIDFPNGVFSSSTLFETVGSSVAEKIPGANHPMIIMAQVRASQIPGMIKIAFAVPQESDVVPDNVNAAHALLGMYSKEDSARIVNEAAGIPDIKAMIEALLPVEGAVAAAPVVAEKAIEKIAPAFRDHIKAENVAKVREALIQANKPMTAHQVARVLGLPVISARLALNYLATTSVQSTKSEGVGIKVVKDQPIKFFFTADMENERIVQKLGVEAATDPAARKEQAKILIREIEKEQQEEGSGQIPLILNMADIHGQINKFSEFLTDYLHVVCGFEGPLEWDRDVEEQLNAQGLSLKTIKGGIVINMDLVDRATAPVKCYMLIKSLKQAAPKKVICISGNHDKYQATAVKAYHVPHYAGFNYLGDKNIENVVESWRRKNPEKVNDKAWWQKLSTRYEALQAEFEKELTKKIEDNKELNPENKTLADIGNEFKDFMDTEIFETAYSSMTPDQKNAWENFAGYFKSIGERNNKVGLQHLGKTSSKWWQEVHAQLVAGHEARSDISDEEAAQWNKAISLSKYISDVLTQRTRDAIKG